MEVSGKPNISVHGGLLHLRHAELDSFLWSDSFTFLSIPVLDPVISLYFELCPDHLKDFIGIWVIRRVFFGGFPLNDDFVSFGDCVLFDVLLVIFVAFHPHLLLLILGSGLDDVRPVVGRVGPHVWKFGSEAVVEEKFSWRGTCGGVGGGPDLSQVFVELNDWIFALGVADVPDLLQVLHPGLAGPIGFGILSCSGDMVINPHGLEVLLEGVVWPTIPGGSSIGEEQLWQRVSGEDGVQTVDIGVCTCPVNHLDLGVAGQEVNDNQHMFPIWGWAPVVRGALFEGYFWCCGWL